MSDKELDLLFQQKFDDFEPEVSPGLWAGIAEQLDARPVQQKKTKTRTIPVFWMAAASVTVVAFTGLWLFYQPGKSIKLHGQQPAEVVASAKDPVAVTPVTGRPAVKQPAADEPVPSRSASTITVARAATRPSAKKPSLQTVPEEQEISSTLVASTVTEASQEPAQPTGQRAIQPLGYKHTIEATSDVAMANNVNMRESEIAEPAPKRRIRSIGGLVNYVVGKVDPRDDKVIEFRDSDEGTEVSGINLGLLKIKSKNNNSTNK
ncbi:hypothetical protein [Hufsiella ginkgonis]|uniref:Uncharacterized protein n=1 Tax=Hufsiella ginkgonis TaxID=2695274 RepID=A0A7K1Y1R0_9SPHI|nr:hypothetical protein [Hufsiella ginkgonis]MXV17190.1 hypothetical protein [Hufsiella ginkgonis]